MVKKISTFTFLILLFLQNNLFAVSSTVPTEGGYGTVITDGGDKITGTFDRNYQWCKKCVWVFSGKKGKLEGDFHHNGRILLPKSGSILIDYTRDLKFKGTYYDNGTSWDFYSGTIEYRGKLYKSNTAGYIEAGNEIIKKFNTPKKEKRITEKPKEKKKKKPDVSPDDNKVVPAGSGSGFFVSMDGHVITNYHVIEGCKTTKVSFNGNQIEAKILAVDKVNDIAILKTDINPNRIFSVSNEDVSLLEDVIVAGFPLGKKVSAAIKTHKGVVTALAGAGDNYSEFQTDATINQGNSGGPVINLKGNVVGIAVALLDVSEGQNMFFAIKSSTLKQFGSSNSLNFVQPNYKELNNKDLGKLITDATVYLECFMSISKIKQMIALENNKKAFFNEFK